MDASYSAAEYALGSCDTEHERLIWQAARLAPLTERLFREAGIGAGQRVLDLGSGVGDVALLAAQLVGPSGEVLGIERDSRSVARARARVTKAGLRNVSFTQSDVSQIPGGKLFDAVVGRLILEFLPDPVAILRAVIPLVHPGGVLIFQEPSWAPALAVAPQLPLWTACALLIRETLNRSGANTDIGLTLHRIFQEAGLPTPTMRVEMPLGNDPEFIRRIYGVLCSLLPRVQQLGAYPEGLGDFSTLQERLQMEVSESNSVVPFGVALVGAWSHRPV